MAIFFGIKQKVFSNHTNRLSFRQGADKTKLLAHLKACELILEDNFDVYKDHCIEHQIQWYSTWIK